jgi:hypothetical protein
MTTLLSTLVEPLKRELAIPGTFSDVFPDTSDDDLVGSLADGFGEAQLRGFFSTLDLAAVTDDFETSEDLSLAGIATIIIFTSMRIIRAQIRAMNTLERYKAGPAEFEIQKAATILKSELDYLAERLDDIIAESVSPPLAVQLDGYGARVVASFCGGFFPYECDG